MHTVTKFVNCQVLRQGAFVHECVGHDPILCCTKNGGCRDLYVADGVVLDAAAWFFGQSSNTARDVQLEVVDCHGGLVAPGFLDLQINGGFGVDFSTLPSSSDAAARAAEVAAGVARVARGVLQHGVTGFCPTLVTSTPAMYREFLQHLHRAPGGPEGAAILGAHLEGPFINPEKKGAHNEHVRACMHGTRGCA